MCRACFVFAIAAVHVAMARADVPQTINHQGLVKVNGVPFDGTGHFKFAILDPSGVNLWTNDNTNLVLNGVPNTFEDVAVTDGVFSTLLGGNGPGYTMVPVPPTVFGEANRRLRIWFDDGVNGPQQLTPDHTLSSSPYTHQAAYQPPVGSIVAWHKNLPGVPTLPTGWVECNGQLVNDSQSPINGQSLPNLNAVSGYAGGRFLRGGTTSGVQQEATSFTEQVSWTRFTWAGMGDVDRQVATPLYGTDSNGISPTIENAFLSYARPVNMSVVWIMRIR